MRYFIKLRLALKKFVLLFYNNFCRYFYKFLILFRLIWKPLFVNEMLVNEGKYMGNMFLWEQLSTTLLSFSVYRAIYAVKLCHVETDAIKN